MRKLPLEIHPPETGIHCAVWLPDGMDDLSLVHKADAQGIYLVPISYFSIQPLARKGIILGYSEYSVEQIRDGIRRLAAAMRFA